MNRDDIFPFEDTNELLLTDFTDEALYNLMIDAANALLSVHGDLYDFVGYWLNFNAHHQIGAAFHLSFENDVTGIGADLYETREESGLGSDRIEGFVMMWNINSPDWQPGTGPEADYVRLVLSHEFEHRFAVFLPDLLDGRSMQGDCGFALHWNPKIDAQGSAMDIGEWTGTNPATFAFDFGFNTDIPGGTFSYVDLYLMGYVTPEEMDLGSSELRFMDDWGCSFPFYSGAVSALSSGDIIAAAGPRVPDAASEDKDYRTAWVMIHRPGDPPDDAELDKAIAILEQHTLDWGTSTLGRGTMDHSLEEPPTGAPSPAADPIRTMRLEAPSPNPMTAGTVVRYALPRPMPITISVHDVGGRRITMLVDGVAPEGWHSVRWNGRDGNDARVGAGTYFIRLAAAGQVRSEKVLLVQ